MANSYGLFFNSENGDRVYDADSFSEWLKPFFKNGVFLGGLEVSTGAGMTISVAEGTAYINGKLRVFDTKNVLSIPTAGATYPRVDNVVVECDGTAREITLKVIQGEYSGMTATASGPIRTNNVYQLIIARVAVPAGATNISASMLTDCRADSELCGYVANAIDNPDFESWYALNQSQFEEWFANVKGQLSEDAAGHLQTEIDALSGNISSATKEVTLTASSWADSTYTISDKLITATSNQEVLPPLNVTADQLKILTAAQLVDVGQSKGQMKVKALGKVPTADVQVRVIFRGEK